MAAERLSKLQKFILSAAYKKTVLKEELPVKIWRFDNGMKKMHQVYGYNKEALMVSKIEENRYADLYSELYYSALYESDILMNFYNKWTPDEKYGYEGGSNKEKTALRRSLKTLYDRGYINKYWQWKQNAGEFKETVSGLGMTCDIYELSYYSRAIITLTNKGKKTAEKLLNVVEVLTSDNLQQ